MLKWIKFLWVLAIMINLSGIVWFIFGSTANFQRGIDLITTTIMIVLVPPSLLLIVLSIILLTRKWSPQRAGVWTSVNRTDTRNRENYAAFKAAIRSY